MSVNVQFPGPTFLDTTTENILDKLHSSDAISGFITVSHEQRTSWRTGIEILKTAVKQFNPLQHKIPLWIVLEFRIPRREKRLDAAILIGNTVTVVEFKVNKTSVLKADVAQVCDYALDLAYYHSGSTGKTIVPVLCPTELKHSKAISVGPGTPIEPVRCCGGAGLPALLTELAAKDHSHVSGSVDHSSWADSPYRPIPGMIEATVQLFASNTARDIHESLAEQSTIKKAVELIEAQTAPGPKNNQKILCLLTGVPGSGKTLTGLQIVHSQIITKERGLRTVFLSGNGPLLKVLCEALARDYHARENGVTLKDARRHAKTLLHSVHSYLDESFEREEPPTERLVVFDEAQRAWDAEKIQKMRSRRQRLSGIQPEQATSISHSEPHQILSILNRHDGAAICVALCGNGQEIHDGEGGVREWVETRNSSFPHWELFCSPGLEEVAGFPPSVPGPRLDPTLHLAISLRSHRANLHGQWVNAVLRGDSIEAKQLVSPEQFPIYLTRDLTAARQWLRESTLGSRRCGILASSSAARLRPYGIEVSADFRKSIDFAHWFTGPLGDLRSSNSLEVAATEFESQGLEIDKSCVCWCWDLVLRENKMTPQTFAGNKWKKVPLGRRQAYALNKYRVLLTRAREGMVIWIPPGEPTDETRSPDQADELEMFLLACGAVRLPQ